MRLIAACPNCGNTTWTERDDGFECLACQDFSYPEDMSLVSDTEESAKE